MEETLGPAGDKTILVVDDDPEMIKLFELTLGKEGFKVFSAKDGADALAQLATRIPDLIVTDLLMPNQGGYELLRNLQAEGAGAVPVIVISSGNVKQATIDMIRQEANVLEFLPKPVPMASFTATLHRVLKTMPPELARRKAAS